MATSTSSDLFDRLRANGVRKKVAKQLSSALDGGSKRTPKQVKSMAKELRKVAAEIEDRASGGPAKRKAAAKKAAATRKRNAAKRSTAAKQAAASRKRGTSSRSRAKAKSR